MNPAPDADLYSVGQESFDWIVNAVAKLAVKKAKAGPVKQEFRWAQYLGETEKNLLKNADPKKTSAK